MNAIEMCLSTLRRLLRRARAGVLRLAGTFGAGRRDRDIADELAAHRDLLAAEYRDAGLSAEDARRAASARFGSLSATEHAYRDRRGLPGLEHWIRDGVYAVRSLRRAPMLALSMVLVLGLGIGLSTALATVLDSIVWQSLPVPEPNRVVKLALRLEGKFSRAIALGAAPARVLRAILGSSLRGVIVGALAGGALVGVVSLSFSAEFTSALFGLSPLDPVAFLAAGMVLAVVVLVAAYVPARRALAINPTDSLRDVT